MDEVAIGTGFILMFILVVVSSLIKEIKTGRKEGIAFDVFILFNLLLVLHLLLKP